MLRSDILDNQGTNNTYYAGGWTEGFMLHEDAIVSGLRVAKDILTPLGCEAIQIISRDVALIGKTDEAKRMISSLKPSRYASSNCDPTRKELRTTEVPSNPSIDLILFELSNEIGRQVMPDETISSLGMTSLNISAVHSRMKESFYLSDEELPISVFFEGENLVSSLASFIRVKNTIYDNNSMSQTLKMTYVDETIPVELTPETEQFGSLLAKADYLSSQKKDVMVHRGQNVHVVSFSARIAAILFQALAVFCQPFFLAIIIYPSVLFSKVLFESTHFYLALFLMPLSILIHAISGGLFLVIIKWIFVGRQEEGITRVWSGRFARRWIVRQCAELLWKYTCWRFWGNTEAMNILYRTLGCNLGKSVSVEPGCMEDYDLVTIGEGTVLGKGVIIETEKVSLGVQTLSPVVIGNGCVAEFESQIERGSTLEDKVYLRPRTVIAPFSIIRSCTNWHGATAEMFHFNDVETGLEETNHTLYRTEFHKMYHFFRYVILFVLTPYLLTLEYGCLYITCAYIFQKLGFWGLALLIWLPATVIWLLLVVLSIISKRFMLGKVQPGIWIFGSSFHKRKLFVDYLIKEHLLFWQTLSRSLGSFLSWSCFVERLILRSLGVKIGAFSQVASLHAWTSYDLLAVGNSVLWGGMAEVHPWNDTLGNLKGSEIVIEDRCFLGAYSQLIGNVTMQQGSTIAACSTAFQTIHSNETVIGTKAYNTMMEQPTSSEWNFRSREIANAIGSFFHFLNVILLFNFVFLIIQSLPYTWVVEKLEPTFFACLMLGISLGLALPFLALVMVWFAKAVLIGSFTIFEAENGSWSNIPIQAFEHGVLSPLLSHIWQAFGGTHLEFCFWIGMGANMGSDVYVDKVKMWEADLVTIGNACCLKHCRFTAHQVSRQSHSFNPVIIGDRCTIGVNAVANGKVVVEDDTELLGGTRPLSGSRMTSGTWYGYPARRIGDAVTIPKPPVPYWSVVIFNPIATIRLFMSFLLWNCGFYGCSRKDLKKIKLEDILDLPKCLQGIFVDKASQLELRFDSAVWHPNQSHLVLQAGTYMITKIKGDEVWWNFVGYEFAFQGSTCQKAKGWVCIGSLKIPESIVSVDLEQNGDQWLWRHSWFKGEPQDNHVFSKFSDDGEIQDFPTLLPGWSWPCLDSTLNITHEYVPIGERDINMHCVVVGKGDETPVLLIHGFPEVSYSWAVHFKQLTKSGRRRLIVPDLRGFGETHSLKENEEWTVSRAAEDLVELLEYYHIERVIIVAHDYGAITGWALQKLYPEKVAGFVSIGFADIALNQIGGAPDYPGQPPCERVIQKRSRGENPPVSYVADFAQIAKTNLQLVSKDALIGLYQMENSSILSMKNTIKDEKLLPDDLLKVLDRCSKVNPIHVQLIVHKNSDNSYLELEHVLNDDTVYSDLPVVIITCGRDKVWTPDLVKHANVHCRYPNVVIHHEEMFHHYCLNQEVAKDRLGFFLAEWLDSIID
jgi:pimeloyl-ACP methyl ester carboxylesterase/acetyltransferase-like isoleucine patch superfamily enzyme